MPISRHIYILAFLLIYVYNTGYSQEKYNNISFEVKKFTQEGDSLRIDVDFNFSNLQLSSREQLVITPVIKNSDRELDLKPLLINGKIRHKVYLRQKAFGTLDDINKFIDVYRIFIAVSVFEVVASEYATRTDILVLALTSLGSGNITMFEGTYPTKVSFLILAGTWIIKVSAPPVPVASSIIHS